jgi:hypothetical protein
MRSRTSLFVIALACCVARVAHADPASDAKDLFDRARDLRKGGDCAGALGLFHKAYEIYPSALGPLRNAAECEESTGKWASARRTWMELKRAVMLTKNENYAGWDNDADAAAKRLSTRVSHLTIDVSIAGGDREWRSTGEHDAQALEVTVNGEVLERTLVGTQLDRDPGKYVVRAKLGDGAPAEQAVDLVTGESHTVRLLVAPPGQPLPVQPKQDDGGSAWAPVGWVTLSLGVGALAGMGVAIGVRQDALGSLASQCDYAHVTCSPSLQPTVSRGQTASAVATGLAVGGGIAAGLGALILVINAVSSSPHKKEHVAFFVSPMGASLSGSF